MMRSFRGDEGRWSTKAGRKVFAGQMLMDRIDSGEGNKKESGCRSYAAPCWPFMDLHMSNQMNVCAMFTCGRLSSAPLLSQVT